MGQPNQNNAQGAPARTAAPATIKVKVRPGGRYGTHREGEVLDVDPRELVNAGHVLVSPEQEIEEARTASAKVEAARGDTSLFRATRKAGRAAAQQIAESVKIRRKAEIEALGFVVTVAAK